MKTQYLTIMIIALMALPLTVQAKKKISDEQLEQKAEEILKSEPDAKQVTVRVEVEPKPVQNKHTVNFQGLDLNGDGVLEKDEVGEKLFKLFDRDGNEVIDNIEMKLPNLIVFTPMEEKLIEIIDYHSVGHEKKINVTQAEFMEESKLSRFDKNADGLSALDFLGMSFYEVNVRDDGVIDLYEWKRAYAALVKPLHMENFYYND